MSSLLAIFLSCFILNTTHSGLACIRPNATILIQESGEAKINLSEEDGKIKIQGVYLGVSTRPMAYKLTVQKKGKGGISNNTQSGKFKKESGQKELVLSTTSFNTQPLDEFRITLDIYQDSKLILQEILVYTAS